MSYITETSALSKLSAIQWHADGSYIYSRAMTPQYAQGIRSELGGEACQALGFVLCEGDRKVMMKRAPAEAFMKMEKLELKIKNQGKFL